MGCDIHLRFEYKSKNNKNNEWCTFYEAPTDGERIYGMFGALANVRNYSDIESLPLRGIPEDATPYTICGFYNYIIVDDSVSDDIIETRNSQGCTNYWVHKSTAKDYIDYGSQTIEFNDTMRISSPDWHTPSWCNTQELEDCFKKVFIDENGEYKGDYLSWAGIVGMMKGVEMSGEYMCRMVFWFDN